MSKKVWFGLSLIFSFCLIAFIIFFFYLRDNGGKTTPEPIVKICIPETYEVLKKFGIIQTEDSIKAVFMSIYNICSIKENFIGESVKSKLIQNGKVNDTKKLTKMVVDFNGSLMKQVFAHSGLKTLLENKNKEFDDLVNFFNLLKDNKMLKAGLLEPVKGNKFYTTIQNLFKREYKSDYEFMEKQKLKYDTFQYNVFDYVFKCFIDTYRHLIPKSV